MDKMLAEAEIPHTMKPFMDGFQICYRLNPPDRVMDAVRTIMEVMETNRIYLEIMGLLTPEEQEHMTACLAVIRKRCF